MIGLKLCGLYQQVLRATGQLKFTRPENSLPVPVQEGDIFISFFSCNCGKFMQFLLHIHSVRDNTSEVAFLTYCILLFLKAY
jgi:hypothetical protein